MRETGTRLCIAINVNKLPKEKDAINGVLVVKVQKLTHYKIC